MRQKSTLLLLVICLLSAPSCFHKSVLNDEADEVKKVIVYHEGKNAYVALSENIFQATNKSTRGGMTTILGYNDARVSVYELATGKLVARKALGGYSEKEANILLGYTPGNLWFFSLDKALGLYSLDPVTLQQKTAQEQIIPTKSKLAGQLALPKWYEIERYYWIDYAQNGIYATDNQGFRYRINPETCEAAKLPDSLSEAPYTSGTFMNTTIHFGRNFTLSLGNELREKIQVNYKKTPDDISFLGGKFILNMNQRKLQEKYKHDLDQDYILKDSLDKQVRAIESRYGKNNFSGNHEVWKQHYQLESALQTIRNDIDDIKRYQKHNTDGVLLQPDSTDFFVAHRGNTNRDAPLLISRVHLQKRKNISVKWTAQPADIFYDVNDARETDAFKKVFSKGSPDFSFQYFDIEDNKLIIVYMLHVFCIDTDNGKVIWMKKL
jgi:hypothetical protein